MKISKLATTISILFLTALFFTSSAFAVEPTTFPNVPPEKTMKKKYQAKPSSTKKPVRKGTAGTLIQPNTVPKPAPTSIKTKKKSAFGQEAENDGKPARKGTKEAGVLVEPTMAE